MLWACSANPLALRGVGCGKKGYDGAADRERIEGAMHQACSLKRIQPSSVPQLYCIEPERRFRAACQPEAGRMAALGRVVPEDPPCMK